MAIDGCDFLEFLGPDIADCIFLLLHDPADIVRAAAVSLSWRRFVVQNEFIKKLGLRLYPEVSNFVRVEQVGSSGRDGEAGASGAAELASLTREYNVYSHLVRSLTSAGGSKDCILQCIGASSTDNFPDESIVNTLEPNDHVDARASYWSSSGQGDPTVPECLTYKLASDLCIVDEIKIKPFKAYFQYGSPIYSARRVRFRMGHMIMRSGSEMHVLEENDGQMPPDDMFVWSYTSPEFAMSQESVLQSFKLPQPVLCIGGVLKIELLGRVQKQAMDDLYYICVCNVQICGRPLSRKVAVHISDTGPVLMYFPHASICLSARNDCPAGRDASSRWHALTARMRHIRALSSRAILSSLFRPVQMADEDEYVSDEEHVL